MVWRQTDTFSCVWWWLHTIPQWQLLNKIFQEIVNYHLNLETMSRASNSRLFHFRNTVMYFLFTWFFHETTPDIFSFFLFSRLKVEDQLLYLNFAVWSVITGTSFKLRKHCWTLFKPFRFNSRSWEVYITNQLAFRFWF